MVILIPKILRYSFKQAQGRPFYALWASQGRQAGIWDLRGVAGGRNEETYSKYAEGIRVKWYPSSRQHKGRKLGPRYLRHRLRGDSGK